jgi:hypothetical protein
MQSVDFKFGFSSVLAALAGAAQLRTIVKPRCMVATVLVKHTSHFKQKKHGLQAQGRYSIAYLAFLPG